MRAVRAPQVQAPAPESPLAVRVNALGEAAGLAAGRSPEPAVAEAQRVARQVDRRLAFSGDHTVVALGGATGSGKSSLFNAISGTQLARSGVRRPTTEAAMAACWSEVPAELLTWMDVTDRHLIDGGDQRLAGLVLLDLPDYDSILDSHRAEVERLIKLVDGVVWVLDPQKYADAALHERYLKPLADYADVMLIVLNQADLLAPAELASAMADLKRLLEADGLGKAKLLATSALNGRGIDDLRERLAGLASAKRAAAQRLSVDVTHAAKGLLGDVRRDRRRTVSAAARERLLAALDEAAGVPQAVLAVNQATRQRGAEATGWPVVSWINRLKPDPLRFLRIAPSTGATRVPTMDGAVVQAKVGSALRELGAEASAGLTPGWAGAVKQAAAEARDELPGRLDAALARVDLGTERPMGWWRVMRVVQWVLIGVVVAAVLWAVIGGFLAFKIPVWRGVSWPLIGVVGGVLLGLLVALFSHMAVAVTARHRAQRAHAALAREVAGVADDAIVAPVNAELDRYARFVASVARAL